MCIVHQKRAPDPKFAPVLPDLRGPQGGRISPVGKKIHNLLDEEEPAVENRQTRVVGMKKKKAQNRRTARLAARARASFFAPTKPDRRLFAWLSRHCVATHRCISTHDVRALVVFLPLQTQRGSSSPSSLLVGVDLALVRSFRCMRGDDVFLVLEGFHC